MKTLDRILKPGTLAYFDTFSGLVPCKVLTVSGDSPTATSAVRVTFRLTAKRGAYRAGEVLENDSLKVCPRNAIIGKYRNRIAAYAVASQP